MVKKKVIVDFPKAYHSRELLRLLGTHGEIVVVLNGDTMELSLYVYEPNRSNSHKLPIQHKRHVILNFEPAVERD